MGGGESGGWGCGGLASNTQNISSTNTFERKREYISSLQESKDQPFAAKRNRFVSST